MAHFVCDLMLHTPPRLSNIPDLSISFGFCKLFLLKKKKKKEKNLFWLHLTFKTSSPEKKQNCVQIDTDEEQRKQSISCLFVFLKKHGKEKTTG